MDEIPQVGPLPEGTNVSFLKLYQSFSGAQKSLITAAGDAYANKRAQLPSNASRDNAKTANKIVPGAEFVPAHPSRFTTLGPGRGPKYKYFIIHRPGAIQKVGEHFKTYNAARKYAARACRLDNVIREFITAPPRDPASTHWVIGFNGEIVQMVDLDDVAWHTLNRKHPRTGENVTNWNSFGVELEGYVQDTDPRGASPFTNAQLRALGTLLKMLNDNPDFAYNISDDLTLLHSEIDPRRKIDPGPNFNVQRDAIAWAQKAGTFTSFYQQPISLDVTQRLAGAKAAAIATGDTSGQSREVRVAAAAAMEATARASGLSRIDRNALYGGARITALARKAAAGETEAVVVRADTILNSPGPVVQENRSGLAMDFDTGEWND